MLYMIDSKVFFRLFSDSWLFYFFKQPCSSFSVALDWIHERTQRHKSPSLCKKAS